MPAGVGNVGYATMTVIPVAKGFGAALSKTVTPAVTSAGTQSGESFSKKFSGGVVSKLGGLLKGAGIAAGVALVGGLVTAAGQRDVAASLQAGMGLSPEVSAKFGAAAGEAYKQNYGESVAAVGDTIKTAFQNGIINANDSKDAIAGVVAQIETYTQVSGEDAVGATRAVAQMIKTGLAKNATEAFDILTRGQQLGINKSEDLLDTFNEYGTQFRKLGIDGPQALGLMNQALKTGARDSDIAADALKEFSIRAVDGSTQTAEGFKAIGLNAKTMSEAIAQGGPTANAALQTTLEHLRDVKDPAARSAAAVQLFGTQAEDLGMALLSFNPTTAVESLHGFAGATDQANKALGSTPTAKIQAFSRSLKQGFVEILGGSVLPAITKAAGDFKSKFGPAISQAGGKLKEALPTIINVATTLVGQLVPGIAAVVKIGADFGKFLTDHKGAAIALGVAVGTVAAAVGLAKAAIAGVQLVMGAWSAATKIAAAAQWLMNTALLASPITWIALGIAAVVAGIVLLATKTQFFQTLWGAVWGGIKAVFSAVVGFITEHWKLIVTILGGPLGAAVVLVITYWDQIKAAIGAAIGFVVGIVTSSLKVLQSIWSAIWGVFGPVIKAVWDLIKAIVTLAITATVAIITYYLKGIAKVFSTIWNGIATAASAIWNGIKGAASKVFGAMSSAVAGIWNAMSGAISKAAGAIWGKVSGPVNSVKNGVSTAFNAAKDAGVKAFNVLKDGVSRAIGAVSDVVGNIGSKIKGAFSGAGGILKDAGRAIIQGLIDGIVSKIGALTGKLGDLTQLIKDHKGPIEKDRRLLIPAGQAIMDSLVLGFRSKFDNVRNTLGGLTNDLSRLPVSSASNAGGFPAAGASGGAGSQVAITVNGQNDPEATARIVGRKLAGAGV